MHFEIVHLDDSDGHAVASQRVEGASVDRIVQHAAEIGQRILIRPDPELSAE